MSPVDILISPTDLSISPLIYQYYLLIYQYHRLIYQYEGSHIEAISPVAISPNNKEIWVVLQKLPHLSDTHYSQVLNKLETIFFMVL